MNIGTAKSVVGFAAVVALAISLSAGDGAPRDADAFPGAPELSEDALDARALEIVSVQTGIETDTLSIVSRAPATYRWADVHAVDFKVMENSTGVIHIVSLSPGGEEVSSPDLVAKEDAARRSALGKLSEPLRAKVDATDSSEVVPIVVILREPNDVPPLALPPVGSPDILAQARLETPSRDQLITARDAYRERLATAVKQANEPILARLKELGIDAQEIGSMPGVALSATPDVIRVIEQWPEVVEIGWDNGAENDLQTSGPTSQVPPVHAAGITGNGSLVAQVEWDNKVAVHPNLTWAQGPTYICSTVSEHATWVAGVIRSTHKLVQGIQPAGSSLCHRRMWTGW